MGKPKALSTVALKWLMVVDPSTRTFDVLPAFVASAFRLTPLAAAAARTDRFGLTSPPPFVAPSSSSSAAATSSSGSSLSSAVAVNCSSSSSSYSYCSSLGYSDVTDTSANTPDAVTQNVEIYTFLRLIILR